MPLKPLRRKCILGENDTQLSSRSSPPTTNDPGQKLSHHQSNFVLLLLFSPHFALLHKKWLHSLCSFCFAHLRVQHELMTLWISKEELQIKSHLGTLSKTAALSSSIFLLLFFFHCPSFPFPLSLSPLTRFFLLHKHSEVFESSHHLQDCFHELLINRL